MSTLTNPSPVNAAASPEARTLLQRLYDLSGAGILSGQHNNPGSISRFTHEVFSLTGVYPSVWGQDFGFSDEAWDGVHFRDSIVQEAISQHRQGSIVTLMWHAVRPTHDEPVTFRGNVCAGLLDEPDWQELTTPNSTLNLRWQAQVDVIAGLLARLQEAKVPVLWRPYHEMNGDWFWWCGREGPAGYQALWKMMYERFTDIHGLNNLLWVWNANAPRSNAAPYGGFYPGPDSVDVLAVDVYGSDYQQSHHDNLATLAAGKPIALGEVGGLPTPETLLSQSQYVWWMTWCGFTVGDHNDPNEVRRLHHDSRTVNRGDLR